MYSGEFGMEHLTQAQFVLYMGKYGLSAEDRQQVTAHLQACEIFRSEFTLFQQKLNNIVRSKLNECRNCVQYLLDYINDSAAFSKNLDIAGHLQVCEKCQTLYKSLIGLATWETVAESSIEIPAHTRANIENSVLLALKTEQVKQQVKETQEKIKTGIEKLFHKVTIIFYPCQPATVFRGESLDEKSVIEHPGGDLILDTGLKNVTLELTSIFEDFTLHHKTDENGKVIFNNLTKGDYTASVEGHRFEKIKIIA